MAVKCRYVYTHVYVYINTYRRIRKVIQDLEHQHYQRPVVIVVWDVGLRSPYHVFVEDAQTKVSHPCVRDPSVPVSSPSNLGRHVEHMYRYIYVYTYGCCQNYGPFWVLSIIRHLVFRGPKRDHNFDNHPYSYSSPLSLGPARLVQISSGFSGQSYPLIWSTQSLLGGSNISKPFLEPTLPYTYLGGCTLWIQLYIRIYMYTQTCTNAYI